MKHWQRIVLGSALSLLSAVLLTAAFPTYGLWPLVFLALVPMLVAQYWVFPRQWSGLAYGLGVGGFFFFYMSLGGLVPFLAWLPLPVALVAGTVGWRERIFHEKTGARLFWILGPVIWVGIEMIRGLVPFFGTWGFPAYALYAQPWLIQPVSVFSIYGLDLLILVVNYALALVVLRRLENHRVLDGRPLFGEISVRRIGLGVGLAVLGWIVLSLVLLQPAEGTVRVAAVHPSLRVQDEEDVYRLDMLYDLTRLAAQREAALIVWNEGALPFDPQVTNTLSLQTLAAETGAYISIGYTVMTDAGLRNESTLLAPSGDFLGVYGKDHPVLLSGETSITGGQGFAPFETDLGAVGTIICYDMEFTDTSRKVARAGAEIIAVPSYDWPELAPVHYTHLVFRAVENRVTMIKADVGFDSAIIDPYGRILRKMVTPTAGVMSVLVADVPRGGGGSLVMVWGDWVGWIALAGLAAFHLSDVALILFKKKPLVDG